MPVLLICPFIFCQFATFNRLKINGTFIGSYSEQLQAWWLMKSPRLCQIQVKVMALNLADQKLDLRLLYPHKCSNHWIQWL